MFKNEKIKTFMKKAIKEVGIYLVIALGSVLAGFAIDAFLVPYKIASGGVSGLSTVIYYVSNKTLPVGILMLAMNIPLFFAGYHVIGLKFLIRTGFATIVLSLAIDFMMPYITSLVLPYMQLNGVTPDLLLFSIVGGVLLGLGLGLVIKFEATTGGSDMLAMILNRKFPGMTVGNLLLIIDFFVVATATIVFRSVLLGLYSVVTIFLSSRVIDLVVEGISYSKAFYIFSDKSVEISKRLMSEVSRGVTFLNARGAYRDKPLDVLLCVVQRSQLPKVKAIVKEIDRHAFVMLMEANEVLGEGFRELK